LALQVATEYLDVFADGVYFVPLATLHSADLLVDGMGKALKLEVGGAAEPKSALLSQLREKEMLLVLDNFEHLLEGAGLLAGILRQAPDVMLLVTSRERLQLQGEWVFTVEGLSVPLGSPGALSSPAELENNDALQLFIQSARRARQDFALSPENQADIVRICQLVAGMPLAIELAAAWVRALSGREIADEIERSITFLSSSARDIPERHRSLTAVFDHSWRLLSAEEQTELRKLAVFQGGFRRKAAEQVAGASLAILAALVDKSLLQWDPAGRYKMHEMVHQYTKEKLEASGEKATTQDKHLAFFLDWAEMAEARLEGAEMGKWLEQLEAEMDNLRVALQWVLQHGEAESGLRLAGALWWFWYTRGYLNEGREWLTMALAQQEGAEQSKARAKALQGAGVLAWNQGDYPAARQLHEEGLAIIRTLGDKRAVAVQLHNLSNLALDQGDYDQARAMLEESLAIKRELGDERGIAGSLGNLGLVAFSQGDYTAARSFYEESLALKRTLNDVRGIAITLGNLGNVFFEQGDYLAGRSLLEESLDLKRGLGDRWGVAVNLRHLGELAVRQGDVEKARELLEESLAIRRELGDKWSMADSLEALAALVWAEGKPEWAALLWGAAEALREAIGAPLPAGECARHDADVTAAQAQLGKAIFDATWAEGRQMSPEQAIVYAHTT
jgi:predicted ATPase